MPLKPVRFGNDNTYNWSGQHPGLLSRQSPRPKLTRIIIILNACLAGKIRVVLD